MDEFFGSVRRSINFRSSGDGNGDGGIGGFVEKIGSSIRKSRLGYLSKSPVKALPPISRGNVRSIVKEDNAPPIRWRKGELIGSGAFGRVYMGMNLDSGELIAIKQVLIAVNTASKEKMQELEEEVKLLKNLSHPNIVRYLGTAREEDSLNILLEFIPGGSIHSLLGKFGSFPEPVIKMYTKQLLFGLEYLHKNGIMHRDIKGANILVDNKGCIKLADFGASKQVVELATISGAKSMKGTPYWMAPEVILQTGHSYTADIWSVGCTVIEMATGKPPWSQQFKEVAAMFHIGTTKSHPPIPEHLSSEAKDFLLKCLEEEPSLRPSASELLQHPFITGNHREPHPIFHTSIVGNPRNPMAASGTSLINPLTRTTCTGLDNDSVRCSTMYTDKFSGWGASNCDDDMCQIDDKDDIASCSVNLSSNLSSDDPTKSFNPMSEPTDDWPCKHKESPELTKSGVNLSSAQITKDAADNIQETLSEHNDFTFPCGPSEVEDDDEVTESKIRAFLDEKALELKKLQTPLYEEFYNTMNGVTSSSEVKVAHGENCTHILKLPPKSKSPNKLPCRRLSTAVEPSRTGNQGMHTNSVSNIGCSNQNTQEIQSSQPSEWKEPLFDALQEPVSPSVSFAEIQRKWKEELDLELERTRERIRQAGGGKATSPKNWVLNRHSERLKFASPDR